MSDGFLNFLKPPGMTSSDAVVLVRRAFPRGTKVGHMGTLDPEAAGVLPIGVGRAARLFDYVTEKEKTYRAEIAIGQATDTQDATGRVVARGPGVRHLGDADLCVGSQPLDVLRAGLCPEALLELAHGNDGIVHASTHEAPPGRALPSDHRVANTRARCQAAARRAPAASTHPPTEPHDKMPWHHCHHEAPLSS